MFGFATSYVCSLVPLPAVSVFLLELTISLHAKRNSTCIFTGLPDVFIADSTDGPDSRDR